MQRVHTTRFIRVEREREPHASNGLFCIVFFLMISRFLFFIPPISLHFLPKHKCENGYDPSETIPCIKNVLCCSETKDEAPKSDYVLFWKPPHFGSQWTHSVFEIDDVSSSIHVVFIFCAQVRYTCAEQYMMAEKAKLFGDANAKAKIMSTTSPCTMRAWGRKVVARRLRCRSTFGDPLCF
jgi:hypothetical protein